MSVDLLYDLQMESRDFYLEEFIFVEDSFYFHQSTCSSYSAMLVISVSLVHFPLCLEEEIAMASNDMLSAVGRKANCMLWLFDVQEESY